MDILVEAEWDPEANVFVAQSADVPGLVTEASTAALLVEKLKVMIPELFALNGGGAGPYNIEIACTKTEKVIVDAAEFHGGW